MLVFEERGNLENPEKNLSLRAEQRTSNKLNPHMTPGPGIEPGTHWWEASAFTTASSLLNYAQNYGTMMHDVSVLSTFFHHTLKWKRNHGNKIVSLE